MAEKTNTCALVSRLPDTTIDGFFYHFTLNDNKESMSKLLQSLSTSRCKSVILNINDVTSWDDLKWVVKTSPLPVVVKGVMSIEQAIMCLESNAQGIVVSKSCGNLDSLAPVCI